nr:hypothetical protein Iba_chr04eCG19830 [Ipomoea batatas]
MRASVSEQYVATKVPCLGDSMLKGGGLGSKALGYNILHVQGDHISGPQQCTSRVQQLGLPPAPGTRDPEPQAPHSSLPPAGAPPPRGLGQPFDFLSNRDMRRNTYKERRNNRREHLRKYNCKVKGIILLTSIVGRRPESSYSTLKSRGERRLRATASKGMSPWRSETDGGIPTGHYTLGAEGGGARHGGSTADAEGSADAEAELGLMELRLQVRDIRVCGRERGSGAHNCSRLPSIAYESVAISSGSQDPIKTKHDRPYLQTNHNEYEYYHIITTKTPTQRKIHTG